MNSDIEHKEINIRIDGLEQTMKNSFEGIEASLKNLEYTGNRTLEQALKTNGRVTRLETAYFEVESDLTFIRAVRKRKWMIAVFILAFMQIYQNIDLYNIAKKLISFL
jgi:hypothetical protein